jgi:hypothetical protein
LDHEPTYLTPYLRAVAQHGAAFESLLWANPQTQSARFDAIARIINLHGLSILDAGCGRADFLSYLLTIGIRPTQYTGVEAVPAFADAAAARRWPKSASIVRGDFLRDPSILLDAGADVIVFCGSLNTLSPMDAESTLRNAWESAGRAVVFNFLASPMLANASHLTWYPPDDMIHFACGLSRHVRSLDDYLDGDCTVIMRR